MLIGLSGYAQSGKDSTADILVREFGFKRLAFADSLRAAVYALDPHMEIGDLTYAKVLDYYGGYEAARETPHKTEIRRLLQRMGTEVGRNLFGENFWVDQTLSKREPHLDYVITDCRFLNEARAVVNEGQVWRITRPGVGPAVSADGSIHPSETSLDNWPFDHIINNFGTLDELAITVAYTLDRAQGVLG